MPSSSKSLQSSSKKSLFNRLIDARQRQADRFVGEFVKNRKDITFGGFTGL